LDAGGAVKRVSRPSLASGAAPRRRRASQPRVRLPIKNAALPAAVVMGSSLVFPIFLSRYAPLLPKSVVIEVTFSSIESISE